MESKREREEESWNEFRPLLALLTVFLSMDVVTM